MDRIPLVDLKASYARHKTGIDAAVQNVMDNTRFVLGSEVTEFENAFAAFSGTEHAIAVGSGTAAIHLSLAALGIGPGDEVAIPAHTFTATAEPIVWRGARPRFIEVDAETGCMDPDALKANIDGVAAVMPVHLYGRPADMEAIAKIAADAGVPLIEDAAQAQGAEIIESGRTVRAGGYGVLGCFSFYPGKNLGAFGDAGAITTNDAELAAKIRMLHNHGRTSWYEHAVVGYADRCDGIQAAVLGVKLTTLDADNQRRRALSAEYSRRLAGVGDLIVPAETPNRRSVVHLYALRTAHREALKAYLADRAIDTGYHYPIPLHLQPAYADLGYRAGDLPVTEEWANTCISLPMFPELTDSQQERIIAEVISFFESMDQGAL
jgi:dTDP-4-amino-4,6-dideoxygalactose transaminase